MLCLIVFVCRIDNVDEDLPIVLEGSTQGFQIIVNLNVTIYVLKLE